MATKEDLINDTWKESKEEKINEEEIVKETKPFDNINSKSLVMEALAKLPDEIESFDFSILGFSNNINAMENDLNETELHIKGIIADEKDEEGKKKYPNEDSRAKEFNLKLKENKEYQQLKKDINFNKNEMERKKIRRLTLYNKFSACKFLAKLYSINEGDEE